MPLSASISLACSIPAPHPGTYESTNSENVMEPGTFPDLPDRGTIDRGTIDRGTIDRGIIDRGTIAVAAEQRRRAEQERAEAAPPVVAQGPRTTDFDEDHERRQKFRRIVNPGILRGNPWEVALKSLQVGVSCYPPLHIPSSGAVAEIRGGRRC